jgi:DNA-binding MurR/RpiR family transcriptional regulator
MPDRSSPLFTTRVREALSTFHPSERRLAELVLNFPGELASYSATELARLANVSNATVTRFVRKIGYANFEEARQHVRDNKQAGASLFQIVPHAPDGANFVGAHVRQSQANIEKTFTMVSEAEMDAIAQAIVSADRVWLFGTRRSLAFAQYLGMQMLQVIPNITVMPSDGETLGETIASITARDVVIAFGFRRAMRVLPRAMVQIAGTGAKIAYLHDGQTLTGANVTWQVHCETASPGPLFNHVAVMTLCHILATRVMEQAGVAGRRRMGAIESIHDTLDEV